MRSRNVSGNTAEMILGTYGHLMPDREETTRKAIDTAWEASPAGNAAGTREGQDHP